MRSFPDDKLPSASITAESLSINIMCIFSLATLAEKEREKEREENRTHFILTRINLTRKVSYLLTSPSSLPIPPSPRSMEISSKRDYVNSGLVNLFIFHLSLRTHVSLSN